MSDEQAKKYAICVGISIVCLFLYGTYYISTSCLQILSKYM